MTCTYCGFCKSVCPTFQRVGWDPSVARGRMVLAYGLLQKEIPADPSVLEYLYQCTTCKDCERRCPSKISVVDVVEEPAGTWWRPDICCRSTGPWRTRSPPPAILMASGRASRRRSARSRKRPRWAISSDAPPPTATRYWPMPRCPSFARSARTSSYRRELLRFRAAAHRCG